MKKEKKCTVCGKPTAAKDSGITLHNPEGDNSFIYLKKGESACLECYIDLCIKKSIGKYKLGVQ